MKHSCFRSTAFALTLSLTLALSGNALAQTWSGVTPEDIYYTDGNVGIGTTTPQEKLHIVGNTRIQSGGLKYFASDSSYPEGFHDARFQQWGRLSLSLRTQGNAFAIPFVITDGSKVGIGTTTPDEILEIETTLGAARVHVDGATGAQLILDRNGTSNWATAKF